jgi:hypothetical protein
MDINLQSEIKGIDHLDVLRISGKLIMLTRNLEKYMWLRIGTSDGHLGIW